MLYHGTHTSLYKTLPPDVIPILEDAILKTRVRLYDTAEGIFNNDLCAYNHIPIVAIEHAELLLHQYKIPQILEALSKVPEASPVDNEEDRDVQQLIAIFRGVARIKSEGVYEPALEEVERLQGWKSKSVDEYTDIQVECIRKYSLACTILGSASNFITDDMKLLPTPNPSETPPVSWKGLTDLRVSLFAQGRFMEALRLSTVERARAPAVERYQTTCLLLQFVVNKLASATRKEEEIAWRAAMLELKLDLGKLFASLGAKKEAETWLSSLEKDLATLIALINGDSGNLKAADCVDFLSVEFYRLKMVEKEDPTERRFQQALDLGERMIEKSYISTEQCHYLALAWARKLYSGDQYTAIRTDIQMRTQYLFEKVQGRVPEAATNIADILGPQATQINEVARNLEMLEAFMRRHPHISLPSIRLALLVLRNVLYGQAGYARSSAMHPVEALNLRSSIPTSFNIRRRAPNMAVNEQTREVSHILDRQHADDHVFDLLYGFFSQPAEVTVPKLLRRFLVEDSASGTLSAEAIYQLFNLKESSKKELREELLELSDQELLEKLVGTSENPVYGADWNKRRPTLRAWLLEEFRSNLPLRQCLWVSLHNARLEAWSLRYRDTARRRKFETSAAKLKTKEDVESRVRAIASEIMLEASENIDAIEGRVNLDEARLGYCFNHYENETRIFRSSLPYLYTLLFVCSRTQGQKPSDDILKYLNCADEIARDQMAYWRSVSNYQYVAKEALTIASISRYKIELRIVEDAAVVDRILEEALEILEDVESLFGTALHDVDLSHTLGTLERKTHVGNKMGIWNIGNTAIRLLHATQMKEGRIKEIEGEEARKIQERQLLKLWQWVQRVKGRTLAQSMGLNNTILDSMLADMQRSINDDHACQEIRLVAALDKASPDDRAELVERLRAIRLEAESEPPLDILPEVREYLRRENNSDADADADFARNASNPAPHDSPASTTVVLEDVFAVHRDLRNAKRIAEKIKDAEEEVQEELARLNARIAAKPALKRLLTIADLLNEEEALLHTIEAGPAQDRFQRRVDLQRLRKTMKCEPVLERMLKIREGWPLSNQDLQKIAMSRGGKVACVDWFRVSSLFNRSERLYMLIWRNGVCKLIDLETDVKNPRQAIEDFFVYTDEYLPGLDPTPITEIDLETLLPNRTTVSDDDIRPVLNCMELIRPLFNDTLIQPKDLLVFSATEGLHSFPLHAIEDGEQGPLILSHPVVYTPSLSVLHKCYWTRHTPSQTNIAGKNKTLRSLTIGGIVSTESAYQYGGKSVDRIGNIILNSPDTTFSGADATLANFRTHISSSDLLHIHLHTNYGLTKNHKEGLLGKDTKDDVAFTKSPLNQAIIFNDPASDGKLTAREIFELKPEKGAHLNLVACASGRHGKFQVNDPNMGDIVTDVVTDEVMGLVPAFMFAGLGSVTSTLWPIQDEHGASFSHLFFKALMDAKNANDRQSQEHISKVDVEDDEGASWIDLADLHQKAVLEMRRVYKQPSAWAGFVFSGYWKFET